MVVAPTVTAGGSGFITQALPPEVQGAMPKLRRALVVGYKRCHADADARVIQRRGFLAADKIAQHNVHRRGCKKLTGWIDSLGIDDGRQSSR